MLENFIYAKQKSLFETALSNGEVLDEAIVFIEDTKEIWNHGTYFDGSTFDSSNIEASILSILANYATKTELNKKQDTISDLATIRANAEKGATALQSVPSLYVTETELSGKGYATTSALNSGLSGKVDKDGNKVLSTNDFTDTLKNRLMSLSNYDDSAINSAVNKLRTDFDTLVSGDTTTAIKTFNEVIAFLDGITDTQDLESIIASIEQQIATKQDKITDLDTIRQGAAKGATALQSYTEKYTGTYSKPSGGIPKKDLASAVLTSLGKADTALLSIPSEYITETELAAKGYTTNIGTITGIKMNGASKGTSGVVDLGTVITSHQDISGKLDKTTAASTYLTKTDAATTYLGISAKAANATKADSATKATQDASGNVITSTYATKTSVNNIQTQIDTLVSGDANTAIESFNEIIAFLEGVEDTETLDGIIAGINTEIAKKADKSNAITNITRNGTTFTATRADGTTFTFNLQDTNTTYTFAGGTNLFTVTPSGGTAQTVTITPSISKNVTYTGTLVDEQVATFEGTTGTIKASGFTIASSVPANAKFTDTTYSSKSAASGGTDVSLVTTGEKATWNAKASTSVATTSANGLMSKGDKTKLDGIAAGAEVNVQSDWNVTDTSSDAYIKNKPTIPAAVTSSTVSGWGFTKNAGTITGIKMNGASKGTSGVVDLGTVITSHQDISGKLDKTTAASTYLSKTDAASTYLGKTAKAASATTADSATKATQDASGNTITSTYATKTAVNSKQDKIATVNHGTGDTSFTLTPNIFHVWETVTTLTLTLATPSDSTIYNEYMFLFTSGTTATSLSLPSTVKWVSAPNIKTGKIYQCSIVNNVGIIAAAQN